MLTRRYVASPLARLASNMRRVRAGDLHVEPSETSDDEVGSTLVEFDLLVRELDDARLRADQEFDARQRMERGLQDADKLITLGQLSAVMAHEIGSPLQILEGRARALLRHADDPAATRRTAGMMVEQTERITRMVQQMLSITRRRMRVVTAVDAERLVRGVVALLEVEARRRSVRVAVQSAGDATCAADADQLQQVVLNLVRNALDASPHGGAITIALCGDDGWITLDVGDEGPGIPAESKSHLFEPFFTTKAQEGGSGLGLSVVRSIVQEHAGSVEFVEGEARGACVRVRIPRSHGEGRS
jgi:signal transduction histidine kinase